MGRSIGRRAFLASAGALSAAATDAGAQPAAAAGPASAAQPSTPMAPAGYIFLRPSEAAFVEAVANHMVPADELTPNGVDLGIAVFVDRALAGGWGKGDRLYKEGPWQTGTPNQGYQLALTPAELYRAGIAQTNVWCRKTWGKTFDRLTADQMEQTLQALSRGEAQLPGGLPAQPFFDLIHQTVMEGMFADPIYGGNRDKAAWKMLGFPGVLANNAVNIRTYNDGRRFPAKPVSIADMS
jgi:gluconate 2-dehydrogenase gamma chain